MHGIACVRMLRSEVQAQGRVHMSTCFYSPDLCIVYQTHLLFVVRCCPTSLLGQPGAGAGASGGQLRPARSCCGRGASTPGAAAGGAPPPGCPAARRASRRCRGGRPPAASTPDRPPIPRFSRPLHRRNTGLTTCSCSPASLADHRTCQH